MQSILYTFKGKKMTVWSLVHFSLTTETLDTLYFFHHGPVHFSNTTDLKNYLIISFFMLWFKGRKGLICKYLGVQKINYFTHFSDGIRWNSLPQVLNIYSCFCFRFELLQFVRYRVTPYISLSLQHLLFRWIWSTFKFFSFFLNRLYL